MDIINEHYIDERNILLVDKAKSPINQIEKKLILPSKISLLMQFSYDYQKASF